MKFSGSKITCYTVLGGHDRATWSWIATNLGAQLVYSGRADHGSTGGGTNPQCLPLDPNYLTYQPGKQSNSYMYEVEYDNFDAIVPSSYETDVPYAVCYVPTRTTLYMMILVQIIGPLSIMDVL